MLRYVKEPGKQTLIICECQADDNEMVSIAQSCWSIGIHLVTADSSTLFHSMLSGSCYPGCTSWPIWLQVSYIYIAETMYFTSDIEVCMAFWVFYFTIPWLILISRNTILHYTATNSARFGFSSTFYPRNIPQTVWEFQCIFLLLTPGPKELWLLLKRCVYIMILRVANGPQV